MHPYLHEHAYLLRRTLPLTLPLTLRPGPHQRVPFPNPDPNPNPNPNPSPNRLTPSEITLYILSTIHYALYALHPVPYTLHSTHRFIAISEFGCVLEVGLGLGTSGLTG